MTTLLKLRSTRWMIFIFVLPLAARAQTVSPRSPALLEEIRRVEKQFETDLNNLGVAVAFEKYAAPDAVIKRKNDSLIVGRPGIRQFYSADNYKTAKAKWTPDYIDVSADGTLAYTYGKYQWSMLDKTGKPLEFSGVFHTVWKKQPDGTWKYVWD